MLITLLFSMITSNAVTMEKEKSVLYSRSSIQTLAIISYMTYCSLYIKPIENGIGLYNTLFNVTGFTQSFNIYIILLVAIISIYTAFYSRTFKRLFNIFNAKKEITNKQEYKNTDLPATEEVLEIKQEKDDKSNDKLNTSFKDYIQELFIMNRKSSQFTIIEYSLITIFVLCGAMLLMSTGDLISLFLSIELQSYGLYILATIYRDSESATGSGLMYFLLGGLSSCFILLGSAILYVNSGTTDLDNLYVINSINELTGLIFGVGKGDEVNILTWGEIYTSNYLNFSLIVLTVGFLFKVSAAPFHFWSPDVYDGMPTIVTTFVAIIAKISIFIILLELVSYIEIIQNLNEDNVNNKFLTWKNILVISSLMSLIIGSVLGLTQNRIKRLLAYSTISHVGFILLALSINNVEAVQGYIFYILQYSLSNLSAFFILVTVGYTLYSYKYNKKKSEKIETDNNESKFIDIVNSPVQLLNQLKGYFHINSFLSVSLSITLFSFVGIPPLIGFFAKQTVLSAALDKGYMFMTLVGVITSVIGAVYYLNMIKLLFFSKSDYSKTNELERESNDKNISIYVNSMLSIIITGLTVITLLFIFMPDEWFRIVSILSLPLSN